MAAPVLSHAGDRPCQSCPLCFGVDHYREECALASLEIIKLCAYRWFALLVYFSLGSFRSFYSSMSDHEDGALDPGAGVPDPLPLPVVLSPEVEERIEQAA